MYPPTVIEVARKRLGASQAQLAVWARTQQSSISEYESRRKSPTLEVTERILAVLDFELAHIDVLKRFGRYPRRNAALGRTSTSVEAEYCASDEGKW